MIKKHTNIVRKTEKRNYKGDIYQYDFDVTVG